eukprot:Selendium_serpulae@DN6465_c0_g1_i2.p1
MKAGLIFISLCIKCDRAPQTPRPSLFDSVAEAMKNEMNRQRDMNETVALYQTVVKSICDTSKKTHSRPSAISNPNASASTMTAYRRVSMRSPKQVAVRVTTFEYLSTGMRLVIEYRYETRN